MTNGPLSSLKVVELASVLAGPAVGQFFAELGAEVIKIENANTSGDVTRSWKIPGEDPHKPDSAYYRAVNYGKVVRMLDLQQPAAQAEVHALLVEADVVVTNFSDSAARKLNMDIATLAALSSRLIIAQLYAFGEADPRVAYDIVLQAEAGFLAMSGTPDGELTRMPVALIDLLAAHQLKEGILIALIRRMGSGRGAIVKANLYHSALASLANQATNYLIAGAIPAPMGTAHPNIAPYGDLFTLADGHRIVLAIGSDQQFAAFCGCFSQAVPEMLATNAQRVAHRQQLLRFLEGLIRPCSLAEILLLCEPKKIPIGHVKNMCDVFAQAQAQAQLLEYPDGQRAVKTVAFSIEDLPS